jgi:hypothetical protein
MFKFRRPIRQLKGSQGEPPIRLSGQRARQGLMGKQTLIILVVSLALAVIAGLAVGFIPTAGYMP